ncbi:hypothetical protein NIES4071_20890 [Calothrix sp. NIES-4071]|nr:hypothetical protein NIES4071_20890 [Calothrix sp. NIES-4071]BAZ56421.1 hypothetical protein NIES4105_20840 [Calothrix sp. NIES-4105]
MDKFVILNLGKGNLHLGFPFVTIQIQKEGDFQRSLVQGSLPPAPEIFELTQRWQLLYQLIYEARVINVSFRHSLNNDNIKIDDTDVTNVSDVDFSNISHNLEKQINIWLKSDGFRKIEQQLHIQLNTSDKIRFLIQTEDDTIRKLPWHSWHFYQNYPRAELGLSNIEFEPSQKINTRSNQVRILAVLGESKNIDIESDRKILTQLPSAKTVFLTQPTRQQLDEHLWDKQGWDILFFAGHSVTQADAREICVSSKVSLSISQLKNALKKAVENGLKIAIFNSCDGLGLVQQLQDLNIPQVIVMREPVPDRVAQEFLKHFLNNFASSESFYLSVRHAREKLQALESDFPCASWLPVICQNPAEISPTWDSLQGKTETLFQPLTQINQRRQFYFKLNFKRTLALSLIVTSILMAARATGIFQAWEFLAYDIIMQKRPLEPPDQRLLIVGADEKDIRTYGYPLPDYTIAQLVNKLKQYQPAAIGLNIVRDTPTPKNDSIGHQNFVKALHDNPNLISVCTFNNNRENVIAPPPQSNINQIGFVDLYPDDLFFNTQVTRRYLLSRSDNPISQASLCTTKYSLAFQLAYRYFQKNRIPVNVVKDTWQINKKTLQRLLSNSGNYQNIDDKGNQLLINYRNTHNPNLIAQQVAIRDVLNANPENFDAVWVKDRVILIGVTAPSVKDLHYTPYGEMRSIYIHAHVVSQLLSTVENNRPMLWWLPEWGKFLWVLVWALTGSVIIWRVKGRFYLSIMLIVVCAFLNIVCGIFISFGGWVPVVTPNFALIIPSGIIWVTNRILVYKIISKQ